MQKYLHFSPHLANIDIGVLVILVPIIGQPLVLFEIFVNHNAVTLLCPLLVSDCAVNTKPSLIVLDYVLPSLVDMNGLVI